MKLATLFTAALLAAGTVQAQTAVWRCGADGRSYSDTPCPDGRVIAAADPRSAAEVQAAREVLARDRALARELVNERHEREREARAAGSGLAGIKSEPKIELKPKAAKPHPKSKKHPPAADGTFRAVALASR